MNIFPFDWLSPNPNPNSTRGGVIFVLIWWKNDKKQENLKKSCKDLFILADLPIVWLNQFISQWVPVTISKQFWPYLRISWSQDSFKITINTLYYKPFQPEMPVFRPQKQLNSPLNASFRVLAVYRTGDLKVIRLLEVIWSIYSHVTSAYFLESVLSDLSEICSDFMQYLENLRNWQYIWKVYHPVLDVW